MYLGSKPNAKVRFTAHILSWMVTLGFGSKSWWLDVDWARIHRPLAFLRVNDRAWYLRTFPLRLQRHF